MPDNPTPKVAAGNDEPMIQFYYNAAPNPMKVALFLEESGLAYEPIPVDTRRGEQHGAPFKAINPNAKLPAIVDGETTVFDSNAVDRIVVRAGAFSVELRKEGGIWVQSGAESPKPVDQKKVAELLNSFTKLKASEFVADEPGDLAEYGLDQPVAEAGFFGEGVSETVFFGKRMDEDNFYVMTSEGEAVYAVPKEHFGILPKNLDQIAVLKPPK